VTKHQKLIAHVLGVPMHKLTVKAKRLGGGFGGKETRSAFLHCATAVAAARTRRPVRLSLDRQADMQMTGHRHAFLGRYRVAYAADGRILALDLDLVCNAGAPLLGHGTRVRCVGAHGTWPARPHAPASLAHITPLLSSHSASLQRLLL